MTFQDWLKQNKARPIGNLTDEEVNRYATQYASDESKAARHAIRFVHSGYNYTIGKHYFVGGGTGVGLSDGEIDQLIGIASNKAS